MSDTTPLKKSRFASLFIMILLLSMLGVGGWASWIFMLKPLPEDSLVVLRADPTLSKSNQLPTRRRIFPIRIQLL